MFKSLDATEDVYIQHVCVHAHYALIWCPLDALNKDKRGIYVVAGFPRIIRAIFP